MSLTRTILLCTLTLSASGLIAQQSTPSTEAAAASAYSKQQWSVAESLYSGLTKSNPDNARYWYRLGVSARADSHYAAALQAFEQVKPRAKGNGLPPFIVDYEIASTYAAQGDASKALAALKASTDAGYAQPGKLQSDDAWKSLRADARFAPLLEQAKHNAAPCEYTAENRQFDFWLGDWDVVSTQGNQPAGSSHIAREMGGCVIWENWQSLGSPYFGKSYNVYNANLKRWEQYWADNGGGVIFFHGNLKDGTMDYWTDDIPQPSGPALRRHLQFFNISPDQVRQFSQGSTDGGKTWNVEYDFTYNRHKPESAATSR